MWFYKQVPVRTVLAGSESELRLRVGVVLAWLASVVILVVLAIAAHASKWEAGATAIINVAIGISGVGLGSIIGEKKGAQSVRAPSQT